MYLFLSNYTPHLLCMVEWIKWRLHYTSLNISAFANIGLGSNGKTTTTLLVGHILKKATLQNFANSFASSTACLGSLIPNLT